MLSWESGGRNKRHHNTSLHMAVGSFRPCRKFRSSFGNLVVLSIVACLVRCRHCNSIAFVTPLHADASTGGCPNANGCERCSQIPGKLTNTGRSQTQKKHTRTAEAPTASRPSRIQSQYIQYSTRSKSMRKPPQRAAKPFTGEKPQPFSWFGSG